MKATDANLTVLEWWKTNEHVYPHLALLAKKYLSCQESSVPSEKVFSLAREIVNEKRCRISANNVVICGHLELHLSLQQISVPIFIPVTGEITNYFSNIVLLTAKFPT